jgi:hypothetical protein
MESSIEREIRERHAIDLADARGYWGRRNFEEKIQAEIAEELKKFGTPDCLWVSNQP